jgi:hypothetical protein
MGGNVEWEGEEAGGGVEGCDDRSPRFVLMTVGSVQSWTRRGARGIGGGGLLFISCGVCLYVQALLFRPEAYVCNLRVARYHIHSSCVHIVSRASPVLCSYLPYDRSPQPVPVCRRTSSVAGSTLECRPGSPGSSGGLRGRAPCAQRALSSSPPVSLLGYVRHALPSYAWLFRTLLPRAGAVPTFLVPRGGAG